MTRATDRLKSVDTRRHIKYIRGMYIYAYVYVRMLRERIFEGARRVIAAGLFGGAYSCATFENDTNNIANRQNDFQKCTLDSFKTTRSKSCDICRGLPG